MSNLLTGWHEISVKQRIDLNLQFSYLNMHFISALVVFLRKKRSQNGI